MVKRLGLELLIRRSLRLLVWFLVVVLPFPSAAFAESHLYVSVAGEKRIAVYARDAESGQLTHLSDVAINGEPGALTTNRAGTLLFASIRSTGHLTSFRRDPVSGELSLLSEIPAGADPAYVSVDGTGKFLLSAYYQAAKVAVHRIEADGQLQAQAVQELPTADKAHAIDTDRSNQFAFVPHTGPNVIFQFRFDDAAGQLRPGTVPRVQRPDNTGPRHLSFHPSADFAYVSDEQGSSITVYRFLPQAGQLAPLQTESTLPATFDQRNSTAHLEVHPSGKFVYVANRGHDSLARFRIDERSGRVTALGQTPTEATPRSFHCEPTGKYLYAAGQASGKLAVFEVDATSGDLSRRHTYEVGQRPWWVMAVD